MSLWNSRAVIRFLRMLLTRNLSSLSHMCCNFWEKCINNHKLGQGCSTPLNTVIIISHVFTNIFQKECISAINFTWLGIKKKTMFVCPFPTDPKYWKKVGFFFVCLFIWFFVILNFAFFDRNWQKCSNKMLEFFFKTVPKKVP